ncbi:MarR family winged helix-turn-helix transcriptional regulator [Metabacillus litoralis]|uniref:MarR family winged helix-turn-helix transcriptional regulator n=1 Tax=Metabacillus TaxID=2675233 RepID=UPI000EF6149A|nr:MarR family transcriptional regulator [Metabacillus litoralis]MCM3162978.1 MarR family transcriptional regulator [Metabacillus litoralis]MCM3410684.1 MarR family transcriptional regulator [Metabacillus litoralis]
MNNRQEKMYEMEALMRDVYKKTRHEMNQVYDNEMSRNEFFILKTLYELGPKKSSDLSKILNVSASHITAVTDSLIEKNWIERVRSVKDRRIVDIHLTEDGKSILEQYEKKKTDFLLEKFNDFSDEDIANFIILFKKLLKE